MNIELINCICYYYEANVNNDYTILGGGNMKVCYDKLWKILIDKKMKRTDLINQANISSNVLARMGKEEPVSLESLEKICKLFNLGLGDAVEFVDETEEL